MKKLFFFAVIAIWMVASAQAANNDTIPVGDVTYQPVIDGKVISIAKGDTAVLTGVDSIVTVKIDTVSNSELVNIYVDGKVKLTDWVQSGYTSSPDPADTTGQKVIIVAIGGDEDFPGERGSLPLGYLIFMFITLIAGGYALYRVFR